MPYETLKALNTHAQAVFDHLTKDLVIGGARKIDNAKGLFMAVCVDRLTERHYSIAHYYEQNDDLMADPDMTFYRCEDGKVFPCSYQQDGLGIYRLSLEITDLGIVEGVNPQAQADQAEFANLWMRNIADQQKLPFSFPSEEDDKSEDMGEKLVAFMSELPPEALDKIRLKEAVELLSSSGEDAGEVTVIYDSRHRSPDAAVPGSSVSPSADDSPPSGAEPPTQDEGDDT